MIVPIKPNKSSFNVIRVWDIIINDQSLQTTTHAFSIDDYNGNPAFFMRHSTITPLIRFEDQSM